MTELENEFVIQKYYSYLRTKNHIKIHMLAEDTHQPASYISRWENNKLTLPIERQRELFNHFELEIEDIKKELQEYNTLFKIYLDYYYQCKTNYESYIIERLNEGCTILYPYYLILRLLNCSKNELIPELLSEIKDHEKYLNDDFKQLLSMLEGDYCLSNKNEKEALKIYSGALTISNNKHIVSLLYYKRAAITVDYNKPFESQADINDAINCFKETFCYKRIILAHKLLATLYMNTNCYLQAHETFNIVDMICNQFEEDQVKLDIMKERCLFYIKIKEYQQAYTLAYDLYDKHNQKGSDIHFYLAYTCYKSEAYNECLIWIKKYSVHNQYNKKELYINLMFLIKTFLLGSYQEAVEMVKVCDRLLKEQGSYTLKLVIYEQFAEYFNKNKKFKNVVKWYNEMITLYNYTSNLK